MDFCQNKAILFFYTGMKGSSMTYDDIIQAIRNLNRDRNSSLWDDRICGGAPHKPLLLLSIMDGIETGRITNPHITLSQELIETFFRYWDAIMGGDRNTTIALPFFHMQSEPFWELKYEQGMKPYKTSPSLGGLMKRVAFAEIDRDLFGMMKNNKERKLLTQTLMDVYFSNEIQEQVRTVHHINTGAYRYAKQLELLVAEPFEKYHALDDRNAYTWQKMQQREYGFGLTLREAYDHCCAVCRARVKTPNGASLVEGAHIIPWSESKNDDPRNGLALCKTHHWMFDTFLLTIQPDYHIKLSPWLKEKGEHIEYTLAWERKEILLPEKQQFLPNEKALEEHTKQFFHN